MIRHSSCFVPLLLLARVATAQASTRPVAKDTAQPAPAGLATGLTLTVRPLARRYTVGDYSAAEQSTAIAVDAVFGRAQFFVGATPLSFSGDTSVSDRPTHSLRGLPGVTLGLGVRVTNGDTLSISGRTGSSPAVLSATDAATLGAVSTAVSAFDATAIGAPPGFTAGYAMGRFIGRSPVAVHVTLAGDVEPRPADGSLTYWQGATVRGSVGLTGGGSRTTLRAEVSGSRSSADSLDGTNLFSGGGTIAGEVALGYFARADSSVSLTLSSRYGKPFSQTRQEVPSRAIPVGATINVDLGLSVMAGSVLIAPGVSWMSESSSAVRRVNNRVSRVSGSSSSTTAHVALVIPIGSHLSVTPDVGGVFGQVSQTVSGTASSRFGRSARRSGSFSDDVRGFYGSLGFTLAR